MGKIITYGPPGGVDENQRFSVRVRPGGESEWREIRMFSVKVDMHDVRDASAALFDFCGTVEVEVSVQAKCYHIYKAAIRPLSLHIPFDAQENTLRFKIDKPCNLSIELNGDRFHNLHLFAGAIKTYSCAEDALRVCGDFCGEELAATLRQMPAGRTVVFTEGVHDITDGRFYVPSDTDVVYEGGAVTKGSIYCDRVENVRIVGRGVVYHNVPERAKDLREFAISFSRNILIEGLLFINPPHYTVRLGSSSDVTIRDIKSFSCEGWSDGIDMMSCKNVTVEGCFMRNSDDCIAVYGARGEYRGDAENIAVKNCVLWADVAHPINIGTHGDHEKDGNILENLRFFDIDILEHHEMQPDYLGCFAINAGDKNVVRNVSFENIRIEHFEHGKLFDIQIKHNPTYNPAPGRGIENVVIKDIYYNGSDAEPSTIKGFDEDRIVNGVEIVNLVVNGKRAKTAEDGNIAIGEFVRNVTIG